MNKIILGTAAVSLMAVGTARAETLFYGADITPLSAENGAAADGFDASARAAIRYDTDTRELGVRIVATGLLPNERHLQHIHGLLDGDSVSPTLAQNDDDGDGFVELLEGVPAYGPILLNLFEEDDQFPLASADGRIDYSRVFDLGSADVPFDGDFGVDELQPTTLDTREIVIHGAFVPEGALIVQEDQPDGITGAYNPVIPVAAGEIVAVESPAPVPLPAAAWMLMAGVGGLGALRLRRRG